MSGNVVPFTPPPANEDDAEALFLATPVLCLACAHRWEARAPVGVAAFECPSCTTLRGVSVAHALPGDGVIWQHKCGCHAFCFSAKYNGWMCLSCGEVARF